MTARPAPARRLPRYLRDDREAWALLGEHPALPRALARRWSCGSPDVADELEGAAVLVAHKLARRWDPAGGTSLRTYVWRFSSVHMRAAQLSVRLPVYLPRRFAHPSHEPPPLPERVGTLTAADGELFGPLERLTDDGPPVDELVARAEAIARVRAALERLPAHLRDVIEARYGGADAASLRAAARALGIDPLTVREREREALALLAQQLGGTHAR